MTTEKVYLTYVLNDIGMDRVGREGYQSKPFVTAKHFVEDSNQTGKAIENVLRTVLATTQSKEGKSDYRPTIAYLSLANGSELNLEETLNENGLKLTLEMPYDEYKRASNNNAEVIVPLNI
jgi:hypothetical protein